MAETDTLIKAFTKFFYRDVMFLLGGSIIFLSVLYVYDRFPSKEPATVIYAVAAGFAYVTGYAVQEFFTLIRFIRTKAGVPPNTLSKLLYRAFERRGVENPDFKTDDYNRAKKWLYKDGPERFRADHERIESLKQLGTALLY